MTDNQYVIVDLRKVSEVSEDEVTVKIVSDRYDDPHQADAEIKKRKNSLFRSTGKLEVVAIQGATEQPGDQ